MHGIRRMKSRNNDRTSNHSIGRNGGVSGRQMIYHLRPWPVRNGHGKFYYAGSRMWAMGREGKILVQRRPYIIWSSPGNTRGSSRVAVLFTRKLDAVLNCRKFCFAFKGF